ncbi:hypothetical protein CAEBREN_12558 [Caenorhabditis brenneri]|uniref:EGF-like domain-containing protein n=1 Tax=Caenorhabditis brenneri TaxID=135651 RepID=G0N5U8_CAEBE|nr:hypothetical protein CAEBREN_12558 [Caenorhabditis brenneri]
MKLCKFSCPFALFCCTFKQETRGILMYCLLFWNDDEFQRIVRRICVTTGEHVYHRKATTMSKFVSVRRDSQGPSVNMTTPMESSIGVDVDLDSSYLKTRGPVRRSTHVWRTMEDVSIIVRIIMEGRSVNATQDSICPMIEGRVLNRKGSRRCQCFAGYVLAHDEKSCIAASESVDILSNELNEEFPKQFDVVDSIDEVISSIENYPADERYNTKALSFGRRRHVTGFYGSQCNLKCRMDCPNGRCDPIFGYCTCPDGLYGQNCEKPCPSFTFGKNCRFPCKCAREHSEGCDEIYVQLADLA